MRVAFIHPFLFRYARGIERYTFSLANALVRKGIEVHLLTWHQGQTVSVDVLDTQVCLHRYPTSPYYAARAIVPFYLWTLQRGDFDWVWIYFADYGETTVLNLLPQQRFGIVLHYPHEQVPHRYRTFEKTGLARRAAEIVSVSECVARGAQATLRRSTKVIHHGVDTVRFTPDSGARKRVRDEFNLAHDAPLLITAAALEERKGIQYVFRALPFVIERFPQVQYFVVGDGPYGDELVRLANELGISAHVHFIPAQANVVPFLQADDLMLSLATGEASSLSSLEAFACGVPVIASAEPPFDELVTPKIGILVRREDPEQVAGAICGLLADRKRRDAMGQAARKHMLEHFTWARVCDEYVDLMQMGLSRVVG